MGSLEDSFRQHQLAQDRLVPCAVCKELSARDYAREHDGMCVFCFIDFDGPSNTSTV